ncbi:hypothetical protein GCM10022280_18660 [Sphingomonas swuensis]|uniref:Uncharacterized protein n=1 Tax=Sphingomonas swuensis TaxID=977800 RepID=A0ABP7T0T6_9SPHN
MASSRAATQNRLEQTAKTFKAGGSEQLQFRLTAAQRELQEAKAERLKGQGFLASIRPSKILARGELDLRISALRQEIRALKLAKRAAEAKTLLTAREATFRRVQVVPSQQWIAKEKEECSFAKTRLAEFDKRNPLDKIIRNTLEGERANLDAAQRRECAQWRKSETARNTGMKARAAYRQAQQHLELADRWSVGVISDSSKDLAQQTIRDIALRAVIALLAIILMPFAVRIVFYFVLAPLAQRGPPIRLPSKAEADRGITAKPSAVTVSILLGPSEELLVRQGFLQSSSTAGQKKTRAFLSWRFLLTSTASKLTFLTQMRGEGLSASISAVDDPFAEVAILDMPHDAACVLQPRAIVAVVQNTNQPLRITSHWRLTSLHAWLTFQFRYLAFHGPASIVVKGGRGVRLEVAEKGRLFPQRQFVGFSTAVVYSTARNETFWPYFFGRDELLKDRAERSGGLLILEEAPSGRPSSGKHRKGLEGAVDALLKAFGI